MGSRHFSVGFKSDHPASRRSSRSSASCKGRVISSDRANGFDSEGKDHHDNSPGFGSAHGLDSLLVENTLFGLFPKDSVSCQMRHVARVPVKLLIICHSAADFFKRNILGEVVLSGQNGGALFLALWLVILWGN